MKKRKKEQEKYLKSIGIKFIEGEYKQKEFFTAIKGKETLTEGSVRCKECYRFRLKKTVELCKNKRFDFFTTTLTVSPHKNAEWINEIMQELEKEYQVKHLPSDFKKENGYLKSVSITKKLGFYRQNYCGCIPK